MLRRLLHTTALRPTIRQLLASSRTGTWNPNQTVQVDGWVKSIRRQKKVAFAVIQDGTSSDTLQAVFTDPTMATSLTNGCSVRLNGMMKESPGKGQDRELSIEKVEVLGECDPVTYPIQKQALTLEYLRDNAHLRARTSHSAAVMRLRHQTMKSLHQFFEDNDFHHIHTPIITSSDAEGAGETFRVSPTPEPRPVGLTGSSASSQQDSEFFGKPSFLTVSSQLYLEALANSISRVWTLSPCFRAEHSQTNRHLAEFWMLEAELAFVDSLQEVCGVVQGCLQQVLRDGSSSADRALLWKDGDEQRLRILEDAAGNQQWSMLTYTDAVKELKAQHARTGEFKFVPSWGKPLQSEHERWIAETLVKGPVFVTDYPRSIKPFYMRHNPDTQTVACFDLLIPHLGELVGGSMREERLDVLEKELVERSMDRSAYEWYLDTRKYGGTPHGGFGIGFERLISWVGGVDNVRECIAMPRWAGRMIL